ncbi:bifunctional 4-hydroxy-2-oxoglutarate aldolase/2-dehydro-3-deoxy-phosphogluconate aldolase [Yoonia sp. R2-816]|uniref:bifunctional 4-hydroxy-2-oxoglutarate aldolase/2-dehydro-3-deoxy-phosphogluconate aldolase n=1 Tax=Yoonia sp. R2-816 TaxID=3342638 RepID=UPI0037261B69
MARDIQQICAEARVIPVLVLDDPAAATTLAEVLVENGLPVLEVTLRTPRALDCVAAMAKVAGAQVGVGTILRAEDIDRARNSGARFGLSPGHSDALLARGQGDFTLIPAVATPAEALQVSEAGFRFQKLFPAQVVGGVAMLKALGSVLPDVTFCPTGGVTQNTAPDYLALPNVSCVGGSWIAPVADVANGNWDAIGARARLAASG